MAIAKETTVKEFAIIADSWELMNKISHANEVFNFGGNTYETKIRQIGNGKKAVYLAWVNKTVDLNGKLEDVVVNLAAATESMIEVDIYTGEEAFGGGMGHYSYATVTRVTGWTPLNAGQVEAVLTLQRIMREKAKAERLNRLALKQAEAEYKKQLKAIHNL